MIPHPPGTDDLRLLLFTQNDTCTIDVNLLVKGQLLHLITPYIRMLDSDWLIAVIFFYKFRPCIMNLQNFYFM